MMEKEFNFKKEIKKLCDEENFVDYWELKKKFEEFIKRLKMKLISKQSEELLIIDQLAGIN